MPGIGETIQYHKPIHIGSRQQCVDYIASNEPCTSSDQKTHAIIAYFTVHA